MVLWGYGAAQAMIGEWKPPPHQTRPSPRGGGVFTPPTHPTASPLFSWDSGLQMPHSEKLLFPFFPGAFSLWLPGLVFFPPASHFLPLLSAL